VAARVSSRDFGVARAAFAAAVSMIPVAAVACGPAPGPSTPDPAPSPAPAPTVAPTAAPTAQPTASASAAPADPPSTARFRATPVTARSASSVEPSLGAGTAAGFWLCRAWERFGAPQGAAEYDLRLDVHDDTTGVDLALWSHSYGELRIGTVGQHGKTSAEIADIVSAFRSFLADAPPRDCEATFTMDATARTIGVRAGKAFSEDAAFDKALAAHLRRVGWAAAVPPADYSGPVFEADDRALYFWKEATAQDRKAHPEALPALQQALLRWLGRSQETMNPAWLSSLGKQATCKFLRETRAVVPLTDKVDRQTVDRAQARFCSR
jgi:hypothetical protein